MAMVPGVKKRRGLEQREEEDDECLDRISLLPDGVLGDIVSFLPTIDGARTQVLSSRWRHIWRSAPLNFAVDNSNTTLGARNIITSLISHILSTHKGPGRCFRIHKDYLFYTGLKRDRELLATHIDCWLKSPALGGLQELEFHCDWPSDRNLAVPSPPKSLHRFLSTLRVASFGGFGFLDANNAGGLQFPVLRQLSLTDVRFSENSLCALLAACPILQSLLLTSTGWIGCSPIRIACPALRSFGVALPRSIFRPRNLQQFIIEDAPCLERLLSFDYFCEGVTISVISVPKLHVLGPIFGHSPRLVFGTTVFQGSADFVSMKMVVHSVKVLSLVQERLSLDLVIEFMKCFPYLEKLYIQTIMSEEKNVWCDKNKNLIGPLDIRLKEIVLAGYRGSTSHANFAKFFVLNARTLQSMRLELANRTPSDAWIDRQHGLLHIKNKASRNMQLDIARSSRPLCFCCPKDVHDLSRADPFQ